MPITTLTQTSIIGAKYFHVFKDAIGNVIEVETTKKDYEQLSTTGHIDPSHITMTWLYSYGRNKYQTVSGDLQHGQYASNGNYLETLDTMGNIISFPSSVLSGNVVINSTLLIPSKVDLMTKIPTPSSILVSTSGL